MCIRDRYTTGNVVDKVTCSEKRVLKGNGKRVALLDLGAKNNIAQSLNKDVYKRQVEKRGTNYGSDQF